MRTTFGFALLFLMSSSAMARVEAFDIQSLPKGKEVTLPRPAITVIPFSERVRLSSTDMPQALKLSNEGGVNPMTVSIFDKQAGKVRKIELKAGATFLYHFKDLDTIAVLPEPADNNLPNGQSLRIESNKPLSIAR